MLGLYVFVPFRSNVNGCDSFVLAMDIIITPLSPESIDTQRTEALAVQMLLFLLQKYKHNNTDSLKCSKRTAATKVVCWFDFVVLRNQEAILARWGALSLLLLLALLSHTHKAFVLVAGGTKSQILAASRLFGALAMLRVLLGIGFIIYNGRTSHHWSHYILHTLYNTQSAISKNARGASGEILFLCVLLSQKDTRQHEKFGLREERGRAKASNQACFPERRTYRTYSTRSTAE